MLRYNGYNYNNYDTHNIRIMNIRAQQFVLSTMHTQMNVYNYM